MADSEQITHQHTIWEQWAQVDPMWAILSDPQRRGGVWDSNEFFASGPGEVEEVIRRVAEHGLTLRRGRCLDFGCGIGRLTQALAEIFDRTDGVDISETMIDLASRLDQHGDRCRWHINQRQDLSLFDDATFDFILSVIVLQHNPPEVALGYIREFIRLLTSDGVAVFDMTSEPAGQRLTAGSHVAKIKVKRIGRLTAGRTSKVRVKVTNTSSTNWPADSRVKVANHWRSIDSTIIVQDDGRSPLETGLRKGASVNLELSITPPTEPGRYLLEIDLVEENACWFGTGNSKTACVKVRKPRSRLRDALRLRTDRRNSLRARHQVDKSELEPEPFTMSGVPRQTVEEAVVSAGGEIAAIEPSARSGHDWTAYRYFVTRRPR
ncbi:MAG: class I SAM-dependent methyltransferase [Candidatus Dormibacteraeota bacterium]|uniref:Class I SAM-dependent methyltransferase n=1 Tax=Candidatus Dormiibacter inghamiae TaxID=3127013 RepID=A0A934NBH0_9BACT|nr:class I SAM-dependent methyltransferase [Candidatus Dormibacteraeota bacterium]MBJ7605044.1 class I SAM-dependent methyltransferase [Candidatus Dormibacteraeota bacterium]